MNNSVSTDRLVIVLVWIVATLTVILATVIVYALWWNEHFACVQYRPF